jgi:hypothetical protein
VAKINAVLQAEADAQRVESTSGTLAPEDLHVWIRANVRRTLSSRPEELAETLFGIPFGVFVPAADLTRVRLGSAETRVVAEIKENKRPRGQPNPPNCRKYRMWKISLGLACIIRRAVAARNWSFVRI